MAFPSVAWHELLRRRVLAAPDAPALMAAGRATLGYGGLGRQIEHAGEMLGQHGIGRASRVALLLPSGVATASALVGVMANAICVPLNPLTPPAELAGLLQRCGADAIVIPSDGAEAAREVARSLGLAVLAMREDTSSAGQFEFALLDARSPSRTDSPPFTSDGLVRDEQPALVLHTSGTTGESKRVVLSHAQLGASASNVAGHLRLAPTDRTLCVMPLFHSHGIVGVLLSSLVSGASVVCLEGYEPQRFCSAIATFQPTWYSATPTIHIGVLEHGDMYRQSAPHHRFRFVRSTSAALPAPVLERLEQVLAAPVIESFGMTEWSQMASNPLPPARRVAGSVGRATGVELALGEDDGAIRVLDDVVGRIHEGELLVRGDGLASEYEGDPEATAMARVDGWFRTGDRARIDSDGFVHVVGRLKELVNRGGEKISPLEIEAALMRHPAVGDAGAFGVPHPTLGEDLAAAVALRDGAAATEAELRRHLFDLVGAGKVPSIVTIVDAVPRSPTGKIMRRELGRIVSAAGAVGSGADHRPRSPIECELHAAFCAVLGPTAVSLADNFFALGGDSLKAIRVIGRINRQFGIKLSLTTLFVYPTIEALAEQIPAAAMRVAPGQLPAKEVNA